MLKIVSEGISKTVEDFNTMCNESDFHRYKSMIYCFKYFQENIIGKNPDDEKLNQAALHLATYLASWGMYRGSSFILRCNYKVFIGLIEKIKDYDIDSYNIKKNDPQKIVKCFNCIQEYLAKIKPEYSTKEKPSETMSTILITKIMLGVFGITPAFDKYFIKGLSINKELKFTKSWYKKPEKFKDAYEQILEFYKKYESVIMELSQKCKSEDCNIPPMRVIDIYFWKLGKEN